MKETKGHSFASLIIISEGAETSNGVMGNLNWIKVLLKVFFENFEHFALTI